MLCGEDFPNKTNPKKTWRHDAPWPSTYQQLRMIVSSGWHIHCYSYLGQAFLKSHNTKRKTYPKPTVHQSLWLTSTNSMKFLCSMAQSQLPPTNHMCLGQ